MKEDIINHPTHYTKGIESLDFIESWEMSFLEGNIVKYITRYKYKNGLEDLKKAKFYLDRLIKSSILSTSINNREIKCSNTK